MVPPPHNNFNKIPPPLQKLFIRAFEDGHTQPANRPSAEEWGKLIFLELETKKNGSSNGHYAFTNFPPPVSATNLSSSPTQQKQPLVKPVQKPTSTNQPPKKNKYMVWKISVIILAIILAILFFVYSSTSKEMKEVRYELNKSKQDYNQLNTSYQSLITDISSSKENAKAVSDQLKEAAMSYPVIITKLDFKNGNNGIVYSDYRYDFSHDDIRYIYPRIHFKTLTDVSKYITLKIKFYNPSNTLEHTSASNEYSYAHTMYVTPYSSINTIDCGGWGNATESKFDYGQYRVEVWYENVCLYSSQFQVSY